MVLSHLLDHTWSSLQTLYPHSWLQLIDLGTISGAVLKKPYERGLLSRCGVVRSPAGASPACSATQRCITANNIIVSTFRAFSLVVKALAAMLETLVQIQYKRIFACILTLPQFLSRQKELLCKQSRKLRGCKSYLRLNFIGYKNSST